MDAAALPLPALRDDLKLLDGPRAADGSPTWTLHDPVRNRFHRLGDLAFEMLARWPLGTAGAVAAALQAETLHPATPAQVVDLARFLRANGLVDLGEGPTDRAGWTAQARAARPPFWRWLLHNYLFVRIPLVRPDRFLRRTWPLVRPLYSRTAAVLVLLVTLAGVYLATRQWDAFLAGLAQYATWDGLMWTAVTLALTKVVHELGHAYTAHRYGCRVPTMGLALLVLWPVLYTDTTDGWRLTDRRKRLAIGVAGITVELALAGIAVFVWSFLPEGPLRNAVFIVGTASWITTLSINLSPFMRFDGYYLLSDWWDVPNLQSRAFAQARWLLRETLFGLGLPPPEPMTAAMRRKLVIYAVATWIYRLVLFLGIALLVYGFFVKAIGILLFVVEIAWFVLRPLVSELRAWWELRERMHVNRRSLGSLGLLLLAVVAVVVPWRTTVPLPALLEAERASTLYAPFPARIESVTAREGRRVAAGDHLIRLVAPDLEHRLAQTERSIQIARVALTQTATVSERLENRLVLEVDLQRQEQRAIGLRRELARLTLISPVDGTVTDVAEGLRPGRWVDPQQPLAVVAEPGWGRIVAYAAEDVAGRLEPGAAITFHPDDPLAPVLRGHVSEIDSINLQTLPDAYLAATQDGPIGVREGANGRLVPVQATYRVRIALDTPPAGPLQVRRGVARVEATPRSLFDRAWRGVAAVVIRESGF